ncbi:uncharacterized protein G6M90_00g084680 [Metarhizium brunneum]|uniref:Uncharacterized protein n=1 Tax=Metarhizium brunneum TaxID=500148 RepID=A0A7D5V1A0_9HYPO|nr:hypothetical protein G6M90_00g084680 [Metarhizium brunneum]
MQLALVSAFAGLALAGPLGARQETLKPFKQPGKKTNMALCGSGTFWGDAYKWNTEGCQEPHYWCLQSREPGSPVNQTKPTRDEVAGAPVTQKRILEIIGHQNIACKEEEKKKIYCTASRKEEQVAVKDGLSPLCQEKGGCEECRLGTVNGFDTGFTCAVGLSSKNQKQDLAEGLVFSD